LATFLCWVSRSVGIPTEAASLILWTFPPLVSAWRVTIGCAVGAEPTRYALNEEQKLWTGFNCLQRLVHVDGGRYRDGDGPVSEFRTQATVTWTPQRWMSSAQAVEDASEEISISLRAMPPVEAFVRALEAAELWTQAMHRAWQPWFAARAASHSRGRSSRRHRATVHRVRRRSAARRIKSARYYQCVGQLRTERNHVYPLPRRSLAPLRRPRV
jgi:hypothetical protein